MGGFHCDNYIYVNSILWTCLCLLLYFYYSPFSFPLYWTVSGGFHYFVFICIYKPYFYSLCPSVSFIFIPLTNPPLIHSHYIPITILGPCSTNEKEHAIFDLLSFIYITQHDLQFHSFSCKWHHFIFLYSWVIVHGIYISYFIYWLIDWCAHRLFPSSIIVKTAAINMGMQVSILYIDLPSFSYMPKSGMAEP
jgi:hypothetical protein